MTAQPCMAAKQTQNCYLMFLDEEKENKRKQKASKGLFQLPDVLAAVHRHMYTVTQFRVNPTL